MIAEFTVRNFYSIRTEQKISFVPGSDALMDDEYCHRINADVRLLKIGIIYGANASGKSNVLQAFNYFCYLMLRMPKDKSEMLMHEPFLLDNHSRGERSSMSLTMYLDSQKYIQRIEFDRNRIYEESLSVYTSTQPTSLYKRQYVADTDSTVVRFGKALRLSRTDQRTITGNTINNCSVMAAFGKSNVGASRLNDVFAFYVKSMPEVLSPYSSLIGYTHMELKNDGDGRLKRFILRFLKASDFNISDFDVHEEEHALTPELSSALGNMPIPQSMKERMLKEGRYTSDELSFSHKTDEGVFEMSERLESSGTLRFMGMAVILYELLSHNRFVAIDEVETSIHYELLSYFIRCFLANSEGESQLLMSTHDINLLNESFIRRDTIWFVDKNSCGETLVKRMSSLGLHKNLSPYNAYKQGKLVKLPFVESPYFDFDLNDADEEE